jgi:hypothetical protein
MARPKSRQIPKDIEMPTDDETEEQPEHAPLSDDAYDILDTLARRLGTICAEPDQYGLRARHVYELSIRMWWALPEQAMDVWRDSFHRGRDQAFDEFAEDLKERASREEDFKKQLERECKRREAVEWRDLLANLWKRR